MKWDDFILPHLSRKHRKSIGENQILQVAVFAILFALAFIPSRRKNTALQCYARESLTQVMFSFTKIVMYYAPIGVARPWHIPSGTWEPRCSCRLIKLILTAYAALLCFLLFVLLPVALSPASR